jgi:hypothetical protein
MMKNEDETRMMTECERWNVLLYTQKNNREKKKNLQKKKISQLTFTEILKLSFLFVFFFFTLKTAFSSCDIHMFPSSHISSFQEKETTKMNEGIVKKINRKIMRKLVCN